MNVEFAAVRDEFRGEFTVIRGEIAAVRSESRSDTNSLRVHGDNRFYWIIGVMLTLFAIQNGVTVALLKF